MSLKSLFAVALLLAYTAVAKPVEKKARAGKAAKQPKLRVKKEWSTSSEELEALKSAEPVVGSWADDVMNRSGNEPLETQNKTEKIAKLATNTTATLPKNTTAKAAEAAEKKAEKQPENKTATMPTSAATLPEKAATKPTQSEPSKAATAEAKLVKPAASTAATTAAAKSATAFHNLEGMKSKMASGAPAPGLMARGPGMGPAPAPAPVPAPLTYEQKVAKMKGDIMHKMGVDSFDADLIVERPNKVVAGTGTGKEHPVPEFRDVGSDLGPYAGPAGAPAQHDDLSFKVGSLPPDASHKDRETMAEDWNREYGPHGPRGMHSTSPGKAQKGNFAPMQSGR